MKGINVSGQWKIAIEVSARATEPHRIILVSDTAQCKCGEWRDAVQHDEFSWDRHLAEVSLRALMDRDMLSFDSVL